MLEIKHFPARTWASATQFDTEFSGRAFDSLGFSFDGTMTTGTGTAGEPRDDGAYRLLGTPELNQAEDPVIRMQGPDWKFLSALTNGCFPDWLEPTLDGSGAAGVVLAQARIKFGRIIPGMLIDASAVKAFLRGSFGAGNDYFSSDEADFASFAGSIRPYVEARDVPAGGFLRPRITQATVDMSNANADIHYVHRFEVPTVCAGFMLRQHDADQTAAGQNTRTDGIVSRIRVEITTRHRQGEIHNFTWGQCKSFLQQRAGWSQSDLALAVGVGLVPLTEHRNAALGGAMIFEAGDSVTLVIDNASTSEAQFTKPTPGDNDLLYVTALAGTGTRAAADRNGRVAPAAARPASASAAGRKRLF